MVWYETLSLLFICLLLYIYFRLKRHFSYFERHGIPHLKPDNWIFGSATNTFLRRRALADELLDYHCKLAPHKIGGFYQLQDTVFLIRDPEIIKNILIKDFDYFRNRPTPTPNEEIPFSYHLFNLKDDSWKNLRIKLTATFSSGKMKMMFPLVNEVAQRMHKILETTKGPIDMKDFCASFTTDVIGSCAFGLETGCLENPESEFKIMAKKFFQFKFRAMLPLIWKTMPPKLIRFFDLSLPDQEVERFFINLIQSTVKYREKNNISRHDFLDLLIALKNNTLFEKYQDNSAKEDLDKFLSQIGDKILKSNFEMTLPIMAAQCGLFFFAGFDTSSSVLSFMILELAQHHDIQDRVRDEINSLLDENDGQVTYNLLKRMTYTDMVIAETLRLYPVTVAIFRECAKNYQIPNTDVIIPTKAPVMISLMGLHREEAYYERPNDFYPEHFTEQAKASRPRFAYLPFGEGPRVCIAERFARMQIKVGIIHLLKDSVYNVSPKMKLPVEFENNFGVLAPKGGALVEREKFLF